MLGFEAGMQDVQAFAAFALFDICLGMTAVIPAMDLSLQGGRSPYSNRIGADDELTCGSLDSQNGPVHEAVGVLASELCPEL